MLLATVLSTLSASSVGIAVAFKSFIRVSNSPPRLHNNSIIFPVHRFLKLFIHNGHYKVNFPSNLCVRTLEKYINIENAKLPSI